MTVAVNGSFGAIFKLSSAIAKPSRMLADESINVPSRSKISVCLAGVMVICVAGVKIDALFFDYQRALHYLSVNCSDIFT